jgi:hypothetical protein
VTSKKLYAFVSLCAWQIIVPMAIEAANASIWRVALVNIDIV